MIEKGLGEDQGIFIRRAVVDDGGIGIQEAVDDYLVQTLADEIDLETLRVKSYVLII